MSLIVLYKDTLIADQCCVLTAPHAVGQTVLTKKIHVSADKTFAFASVGPTLTDDEKKLLEEIIRQTFRVARGEKHSLELEHQDWFSDRSQLNFMVMTKQSNYFAHLIGGMYDRNETFRPRGASKQAHSLTRFDSSIPACYGTGAYAAFIATSENVPMEQVVPLVSDVIYSVSREYSIFHRHQLKRMSFK